jgi:hypothetical protein
MSMDQVGFLRHSRDHVAACRKKIGPHSQRGTLAKLDGRGLIARRMRGLKDELVAALGGLEVLSPQKILIIQGLCWRVVRCEQLLTDSLAEGEVAVSAEQRISAHLSAIRQDLLAIGLEKWEPPPLSLTEYLKERSSAA